MALDHLKIHHTPDGNFIVSQRVHARFIPKLYLQTAEELQEFIDMLLEAQVRPILNYEPDAVAMTPGEKLAVLREFREKWRD